jgi:FkbM family methyltransferase
MSNWKFYIGKTASELDNLLVRSGLSFVHKHYPYGRNWILDAKRILKQELSIIIDAGANVGSVSNELNYWFPNAEIFAFEPVKDTYHLLLNNTAGKNHIHPLNDALGAANEKITIAIGSENTINSLKVDVPINHPNCEEVNVVRLDDFLANLNLDKVDILKIDVEGFEFEVLDGCGKLEIDCIYLEVGYDHEPTKVYFAEVDNYMEKKGYKLSGIYEIVRNMYDKRKLAYANCLYLKKEILE